MKKLYAQQYDLRTGDFDRYNHIRASSVLDLFQDAAGRHAEEINVGYEAMKNRSYFWVLVKTKFKIVSQPAIQQRVVVKTWPLEPNRYIYRREYKVENETGETLILGSSEWVVIHSEKRRLVSAPDLYSLTDGFHPEINFDTRLEKVEDFETDNTPYVLTPGFSQIDVNSHVNNTKYADFVLDAVNPDENFEIDVFQIDYRKEVLPGVTLNIHHKKEDNLLLAKGINEDNNVMFNCSITYKNK